jgi:hypothetical protein
MFYNDDIQVVRVNFDKVLWDTQIFPELYSFYFRFIIPEIYFHRVQQNKPLYKPIVKPSSCCTKRELDDE